MIDSNAKRISRVCESDEGTDELVVVDDPVSVRVGLFDHLVGLLLTHLLPQQSQHSPQLPRRYPPVVVFVKRSKRPEIF